MNKRTKNIISWILGLLGVGAVGYLAYDYFGDRPITISGGSLEIWSYDQFDESHYTQSNDALNIWRHRRTGNKVAHVCVAGDVNQTYNEAINEQCEIILDYEKPDGSKKTQFFVKTDANTNEALSLQSYLWFVFKDYPKVFNDVNRKEHPERGWRLQRVEVKRKGVPPYNGTCTTNDCRIKITVCYTGNGRCEPCTYP